MKLFVEGYKSIASQKAISLPGLTILAGSNSSGKSSFMQPFLLLKQTVENHYDDGSLLLDGDNIKVTDSSQIFSRVLGQKKNYFAVQLSLSNSTCGVKYLYKDSMGVVAESVHLKDENKFKEGITLRMRMKSDEIDSQIPEDEFGTFKYYIKSQGFECKWKTIRNKCFINAELGADLNRKSKNSFPIKMGMNPTGALEDMVVKLIHVPGLRGNPERTYKIAASEAVYPGSFEKYIASIITEWGRKSKHSKKLQKLRDQLQELGLTKDISTEKVNDTRVEIRVSRNKNKEEKDYVNIADVGFGVSQVLPVLVALICAQKDQLVYIEQPELHLHPRAQYKLGQIISEAASRGVKVIIETHSSVLLRSIQIQVVTKKLDHRKVSLNWFTQGEESGETEISSAELDEYGAFGDWPEDFDDVTLRVEQIYLDSIEEALSGS